MPLLLHATGDVATKAVTVPARFTRAQVGRLNRHYHAHTSEGTRTAVAYTTGIGLAAIASAVLTHKMAGSAPPPPPFLPSPPLQARSLSR